MDRNNPPIKPIEIGPNLVALRKESVDRNLDTMQVIVIIMDVALRKESVDRNPVGVDAGYIARPSLSARRAWIEISPPLRLLTPAIGRSPQGERG